MDIAVLLSLFFVSFLAATVLPLSSEIALTGAFVAGVEPIYAVAVASLGNILGSATTYAIGRAGKIEWITKYLRVSEEKLAKVHHRWINLAPLTSFLCFLPLIGDIFAISLGLARYNPRRFMLFMSVGKVFRYTLWYLLYNQAV